MQEEDGLGSYHQPSKKRATLRSLRVFPSSQKVLEEELDASLEHQMSGVELLKLIEEISQKLEQEASSVLHSIDYWRKLLVKMKVKFARRYLAII